MSVILEAGPDAGAIWHYGDPFKEQRSLAAGVASVDLGHLPIFGIDGPDRLTWLDALTTQRLEGLALGTFVRGYFLDAQGHVQHSFSGMDDGEVFRAFTEPGHLEPLLEYLLKMRFRAKVAVSDVSDSFTVIQPAGASEPQIVPRTDTKVTDFSSPKVAEPAGVAEMNVTDFRHPTVAAQAREADMNALLGDNRAGLWAAEALRIASGQPRTFLDFDEKTLPNELANPDGDHLGAYVHLHKGCYPGQETVAKIYNIGKPPRRLTLLHLDGSEDSLPEIGADILHQGRVVGRMGTSERHYELGPIGLALLKRDLPIDAQVSVGEIAASQQPIVDPNVGLHVRSEVSSRPSRSLL